MPRGKSGGRGRKGGCGRGGTPVLGGGRGRGRGRGGAQAKVKTSILDGPGTSGGGGKTSILDGPGTSGGGGKTSILDGPGTSGGGGKTSILDGPGASGGGGSGSNSSANTVHDFHHDLQKVRKNRAVYKKNVRSLSKEDREKLKKMMRKKEVNFFLMPDAPEPKKKSRKISSPVSWNECILVPGTPPEPPPKEKQVLSKGRGAPAKKIKPELLEIDSTQIDIEYINMSPSWAAEIDQIFIDDDPVVDKDEAALRTVYCESLQAAVDDSQIKDDAVRDPVVDKDEAALRTVYCESLQAAVDDSQIKDDAVRDPVVDKDEAALRTVYCESLQAAVDDSQIKDDAVRDPVVDKDEAIIQSWIQNMDSDHDTYSHLDIDADDENDITFTATNLSSSFQEDIPFYLDSQVERQIQTIDSANDSVIQRLLLPDTLNFNWTNNRESFTGVREQFKEQQGPTFYVSNTMTPLDIFDKIWDNDIILKIVEETNKNAETFISTNPQISKMWKPVTADDIWIFFAIIIIQGNFPRPIEREYWYSSSIFTQMTYFKLLMPFKRFLLIKKFLHFNDNAQLTPNATTEEKKLFKIKPITEHLNKKFQSLFYPGPEVSLDESLLLWKGKLSFSQKILTKAAQVGIKSYELCDSKTGYLWKFIIYTGKSQDHTYQKPDAQDQPDGATANIVFDLASPLFYKGHVIIMDNFYNSPLLTRCLKQHGTDTVGTLRISREFVPESLKEITKSNMCVGQVAFSMTHDMTIVVWRDANIISMISSYHEVEVGGKEKHGTYKYRPKVVLDYNLAMGGVDRKDQLLAAFPMERCKNLVWYKKLFRRLFNTSILNANIIYNCGPNNLKPRNFRQTLFDLIVKRSKPKIAQTITTSRAELPTTTVEGQGHYPERGKSKQARCKWCARKKILTRTTWQCDVCKVSLCIESCFKNYHTSRS